MARSCGLRKVSIVAGAEDRATSLQDAAMAAAEQIAENEERAALVEKRNAALALQAKTRGISLVLTQFPGREAEGMKALIAGSQLLRAGARTSVALESQQFHGKWLGGLEGDLRKAGLWQFFVEDAYQDDVARALWQHSLEGAGHVRDPSGCNPHRRHREPVPAGTRSSRRTGTALGLGISAVGCTARRTTWTSCVRPASRSGPTFVDARLGGIRITEQLGVEDPSKFDRAEFLRAAFHDLSNGDHFKPASLFEIRPSVGPGNMAKKVSQSRRCTGRTRAPRRRTCEFGPANGSLAETVLNDFRDPLARWAHEGARSQLRGESAGDPWITSAKPQGNACRRQVASQASRGDGPAAPRTGAFRSCTPGSVRRSAPARNWQSMAKLGSRGGVAGVRHPRLCFAISHRFDVSIFDGLRDAGVGDASGPSGPTSAARSWLTAVTFESVIISISRALPIPRTSLGRWQSHKERFFKWGHHLVGGDTAFVCGAHDGAAPGRLPRPLLRCAPAATRDMLSPHRIDEARWGSCGWLRRARSTGRSTSLRKVCGRSPRRLWPTTRRRLAVGVSGRGVEPARRPGGRVSLPPARPVAVRCAQAGRADAGFPDFVGAGNDRRRNQRAFAQFKVLPRSCMPSACSGAGVQPQLRLGRRLGEVAGLQGLHGDVQPDLDDDGCGGTSRRA